VVAVLSQGPALISLTFRSALDLFKNHDSIAVDTETNALDVRDGTGRANGISISTRVPALGVVSYYFSIHHRALGPYPDVNLEADELFELKQAIENYKGHLIFHNAKFDLESLRTIGIKYTGKFYDTMLMAHIINENMPMAKSLDACAAYYLKEEGKRKGDIWEMLMALYGWDGMPAQVMAEYAEYDANMTYRLWEILIKMFTKENLLDYWDNHKAKFLRVVVAMERRGIFTDETLCKRMTAHGQIIMEECKELLGGYNPGSFKDLEHLLIETLGLPIVKPTKGTAKLPKEQWKPSFDKEAMELYERILETRFPGDDRAQLILTYRGWQKAVSSCYIPYVEKRSWDGKLRCNYKLHGTKTGRMSCENPNLQQIPRSGSKPWNGEMKKAFLPTPGYTLFEADYSQLELRLGTAYAGEEALKTVFNNGEDIFNIMKGPLGLERQDTKTFVYTTQYGGGITRLTQVFGWSPSQAERYRDKYFEAYPGFRAKAKVASLRVKHSGQVKLWSGRARHFMFRDTENHKAWNSVIQGGAADIVERTMIRLFEQVDDDEKCRMLLQVHDSVVFEVRNDVIEEYTAKIKEVMENVEPDFGVRFAVDIHKFGEG
jgi:DNA polymerase-1